MAAIIQDLGVYPSQTKDAEAVKQAFTHFMGPFGEPREVYTDSAEEYNKAFQLLKWNHRIARPHRPQTNGVAERAVRRITEATRCALLSFSFAS